MLRHGLTALLLILLELPLSTPALVLTGSVEESVLNKPEKGIVGMDIQVPKTGYPLVKQVFTDAPAFFAGLKPGDCIIKINGQLTYGKTPADIDEAISDIPGTPVSVTIKRVTDDQYHTVTLVVAPLSRTASHVKEQYVNTF